MRFENHFRYWLRGVTQRAQSITRLVVEPAGREEEKLGAIGAIGYVLDKENLTNDDLLIVAGDNLFEFRLPDFVDFYKKYESPIVAFCDLKSIDRVKGKYGVGMLDKNNKVIDFQEKPIQPKSSVASTACYLFPTFALEYIQQYLKDKNNADAPGHFIAWLSRKTDVYGFTFDGAWHDIGSLEVYDQANEYYNRKVRI